MLQRLQTLLPIHSRQYREATSQRIAWGHWFALFNIVIALLISSRYAFNADWPNTLSGKLYFFTSLFGHFSFVVFGTFLLILFPLSFLIKNERTFRGISVILATIGQTILLVDTEVFKRFYLHLSPLVWDLLVNPDNGELARKWQLLFTPMPILLLAEMLYSRWCWQKLRSFNRQTWGKYVAFFFLSCFIATHLIYAWADMAVYRPITAQKANYPLSYPMTARSFLEKHGLINKAGLQQEIEESGRLDSFYLNYPKRPLQLSKSSNTNVLIINFSGLSNEAITPENMPILSQVSQQSYRFNHHYISADSQSGSILGLFYSLSGRYLDTVLGNKEPSPLINAFRQANYQLGLFSHNGFSTPIYHQAAFAGILLPYAKDNLEAINQWENWLEQRTVQPFFSYLDLKLPQANDYAQKTKLYDWQFNEIWQSLNAQGLLANTLVIITADQAQPALNHHSFAKEYTQVPFIIYWQGEQQEVDYLSSHLDVLPTLLTQFFGITNPTSDYAQGIDLTTKNERRWLLASNYQWNVAIMPDGEQYHLDKQGHFEKFDSEGNPEKTARPPLPLFLQLIHQSNQFVEK